MRRYFCPELRGDRNGNREAGEWVFRIMPPLFEFTFYSYATRRSWVLRNTCWNVQARSSFQSLRPSGAWIMGTGVNRSGQFRAIAPTTATPMLPITVDFDCEISWEPSLINMTTVVNGACMLFSMRPPESRPDWVAIDRRPPMVVYLTPDQVTAPERIIHVDSTTPSVIAPVENHVTAVAGSPSRETNRGPNESGDTPGASSSGLDSQNYPAVEIIEEVSGIHPFARPVMGSIPFSGPPITLGRPGQIIGNRGTEHRPITIETLGSVSAEDFDLPMAVVRAENHRRLDGNHGTMPPPGTVIAVKPQSIISPRPHIVPTVMVTSVPAPTSPLPTNPSSVGPPSFTNNPSRAPSPRIEIIPRPSPGNGPPRSPSTPKQVPPPPTFAMFLASQQSSNTLNNRVLRDVRNDLHPRNLLTVESLSSNMRVESFRSRTGTIHPPIPFLDPPSSSNSSSSSYFPPSPLRTADHGIRLEITPAATALRNRPEEEVPAAPNAILPAEIPDPETNPEC